MCAALLQEKKQWLEKLRGAEAEVERCRAEAQQLRLQHLQLPHSSGSSSAQAGGGAASCGDRRQQEQELLQRLLEAQAGESALRSVLGEAREEQVAACKALSGELRRVHALERLRISEWNPPLFASIAVRLVLLPAAHAASHSRPWHCAGS